MSAAPEPVLVVVNDLFFESKIGEVLRALGVRAAVAKSAESLEKRLAEHAPTLAFVDMGARGFDGKTAIETIRRSRPEAKIVAFISHVRPEDRKVGRDAGADLVLVKSALVQQLPDIVRASAPQAAPATVPAPSAESHDHPE